MRGAFAVLCLSAAVVSAASPRTLDLYFIDVEGGQSTLMVTPAGESLLIDAGYAARQQRSDAGRIMEAVHDAGLDHIDYLLITHFHPDHAGGVPELAMRIPIKTLIDYGEPMGTDRMAAGSFRAYQAVRSEGHDYLRVHAGDRLPLKGIDADVVSAGGELRPDPLPGAGRATPGCSDAEDQPEDGTENFRSVGVRFQMGAFRFLDLGDLSGNTLTRLVCPVDLVGQAAVYLVAHHGNYDTSVRAVANAIRPQVAIMNNGPTKGGDAAAFTILHEQHTLEDLWQLHVSADPHARNSPDDFIANTDDGQTGYWLKLTATEDGTFTIVNSRNGFSRTYSKSSSTR